MSFQPAPIPTALVDGTDHITVPWAMYLQRMADRTPCIYDKRANRTKYLANLYPGNLYFESDTGLFYLSTATGWIYAGGIMRDTFANAITLTATLTAADTGLLYEVTTGTAGVEYYHTARWTGTAWEAKGDWGAYVAHFVVAPLSKGWHLINGSATKYLSISAGAITEVNFTPVDETAGIYRKSAAAYGAGIVAAIAPGLTGQTADESTHTHAIDHDHPSATSGPTAGVGYQPGTGVAVSVTPGGSTVSVDLPAFTGTSGPGTAHHHGKGTLAVDAAGEPAHQDYLPYFRR